MLLETKEKTSAAGDTISILIDATDPIKDLKVGKQLNPEIREALISFLKENLVIFV